MLNLNTTMSAICIVYTQHESRSNKRKEKQEAKGPLCFHVSWGHKTFLNSFLFDMGALEFISNLDFYIMENPAKSLEGRGNKEQKTWEEKGEGEGSRCIRDATSLLGTNVPKPLSIGQDSQTDNTLGNLQN